ncbi:MAG: HIT family protein [Spirochaetota bacterium]
MSKHKCVFCDIVSGKTPAYKVMEDELSMVILDINPYSKGHCLVIPKRHVLWWHEMTEEETVSLFKLAHRAANKIMKTLKPDFVCLYARGKRIPHTHIFLIPTVEGDVLDRFYSAMEKIQESPQKLVKIKEPGILKEAAELLRK